MTDEQKREIVEQVARNVRDFDYFDGPQDIVQEILEAADYFELRAAVEKAVEELAARARIDNYPAVVADGYVVRMLRAALKGGGESDT